MERNAFRIMMTALILLSWTGLSITYQIQEAPVSVVNYPNPFDSRLEKTTIAFKLEQDAVVNVRIYDLFGNMVREYQVGPAAKGVNRLIWDGTNEASQKVSKGGYIALVEVSGVDGRVMLTRKIGVIH